VRACAIEQPLNEITASYEDALCRSEGVLRGEGDELRWYPYDADERDR
jgi:hypothetical protein